MTAAGPIEQLNRDCFCLSLDPKAIPHALYLALARPEATAPALAGQVDSVAAPANAGWPTTAEREHMHAMLFEPAKAPL